MVWDMEWIKADCWREKFRVRSYEVNAEGRLTVPVLLNYLQEAASNDAESLRVGISYLTQSGRIWVLSRIGFHVKSTPRWGDSVVVHTWPNGVDGLFALREFRVTDKQHRVLIYAGSAWLLIDKQSRKPVRVHRVFAERRIPLEPGHGYEPIKKISPVEHVERESFLIVQHSDIDVHDHVNNARYVEWVLNTYPEDFFQKNSVRTCTINFLSECGYGDKMVVRGRERPGGSFSHCVSRHQGGNDACRMVFQWRIGA
jgi:acyl-ACP thioesterase